MEGPIFFHQLRKGLLHADQDVLRQREERKGQGMTVIVAMIDLCVLQAVQAEVGHTAEHRLKAFLNEEIFQMVIAQRGILHVDLPDDPDADLLFVASRDRLETIDQIFVKLLGIVIAVIGKLLTELLDQRPNETIGLSLVELIRLHLVFQPHDRVSVQKRIQQFLSQRQRQFHAVFFFQTGEIDGQHRNVFPAFMFQRLSQQEDVVAGAAAAAGLCDRQGHFVEIIFPALERRDHLSDDEQRRITRIVMHMAESFFHDLFAFVVEHFHMIACGLKDRRKQTEVDIQHARHQYRMCLFHIRGKDSIAHVIDLLRDPRSPPSENEDGSSLRLSCRSHRS